MPHEFTLSYSLLGLLGLACIYFVLYAGLRREMYRCDIRRIRDNLFDFMWQNGYDFKTAPYQEARLHLNQLLQVSNHLSPSLFVLGLLFFRLRKVKEQAPLAPEGPIPEALTAAIEHARADAVRVTVHYVFMTGLKGGLFFLLRKAFSLARRAVTLQNQVNEATREAIDRLQDFAPGVATTRQRWLLR